MIATQRRDSIEKYINDHGSVSVDSLLDLFPVSKMTLWRDLTELDRDERVRKVHGGAVRCQPVDGDGDGLEPGFYSKSVLNHETKCRIARKAAQLYIQSGEVIVLEGGTTAMQMVEYVEAPSMTVLTNGLNTLNAAAGRQAELTIMVCGGILRKPSLTFVGPEAERFFRDFSADTLFLSGTGLTISRGLTDPNPLEIQVKRAMIECAKRRILLLDSSKINEESLKTVAMADEFEALITDSQAPVEFVEALRDRGVKVILA